MLELEASEFWQANSSGHVLPTWCLRCCLYGPAQRNSRVTGLSCHLQRSQALPPKAWTAREKWVPCLGKINRLKEIVSKGVQGVIGAKALLMWSPSNVWLWWQKAHGRASVSMFRYIDTNQKNWLFWRPAWSMLSAMGLNVKVNVEVALPCW